MMHITRIEKVLGFLTEVGRWNGGIEVVDGWWRTVIGRVVPGAGPCWEMANIDFRLGVYDVWLGLMNAGRRGV